MSTEHLTKRRPRKVEPSRTGRRIGYVIAAAINVALLYFVNNLLNWDLSPFLTDDFERVIPLINVSLVATIVVNVIYLFFDRRWFKSLTQIGLAGIAMAATVRLYRVFPFDFSAYDFAWATLARAVLIIAMVGMAIAIVAETVKLIVRLARL
jgi:hypothetical protein